MAFMAAMYNVATFDPSTGETDAGDMSAFHQADGKLIIMYHGLADAAHD
jgi:hypothetical protein